LVDITVEPKTTPLSDARRVWKDLAILLRRGLLSFALLLFLISPTTEVNDGRDKLPEWPRQCGPLKADFSDPCNSILAAAF
jgi:hypothetical protein